MFGIAQIKTINENETRKRLDKQRQSRGLKAKDPASAIERKVKASRPRKVRTLEGVRPGSQFSVGE
jgi:hypothetical protein